MNKVDVINIVKKYNFDVNKYIIISGANMVLRGIKSETVDIDIAVESDYYSYLIENYNCVYERTNEYGVDCYLIDGVINFATTYYSCKKEFINGVPLQTIEELLKLKKELNRKKDQKDIILIKEYINE